MKNRRPASPKGVFTIPKSVTSEKEVIELKNKLLDMVEKGVVTAYNARNWAAQLDHVPLAQPGTC